MAARLAVIQKQREMRRSDAERYLRLHYRLHRRIAWGPLTSLVGIRRVQDLIFLGELEHRSGLVSLRRLARRACFVIAVPAFKSKQLWGHLRRRRMK